MQHYEIRVAAALDDNVKALLALRRDTLLRRFASSYEEEVRAAVGCASEQAGDGALAIWVLSCGRADDFLKFAKNDAGSFRPSVP